MTPFDIKAFIQNPMSFLGTADDSAAWKKGLTNTLSATEGQKIQLRDAQVDAWNNMENDQVGLLLGPPGTGKTLTVSAMSCGLLSACQQMNRPCRILVTGFTRNSIENVLEYIDNFAKQYPGLQFELAYDKTHSASSIQTIDEKTFANFHASHDHSVYGATIWTLFKLIHPNVFPSAPTKKSGKPLCLGIFDFIIIDEASQMQFSHGLMAMAGLTEKGRILVCGDNLQLPPIFSTDLGVEDNIAEQSIYDFLAKQNFPEQPLNETFRLNAPLVAFPSQEYYSGNYISAPEIQNRRMKLTNGWRMNMDKWKQAIIDPELPFVVLIHDGPEGGKENPIEAQLAAALANEFHNITTVKPEEFWTEDVAIMSPHNKHNDRLRTTLGHHTHPPIVETVDRFQGRERNCVIYSLCVSDPEFAQSEATFLLSPQRLNVAITRARSKLIILVHKNILNISVRDDDAIDALRAFRNLIFSTSELGSITLEMESEDNHSTQLNLEMRGNAFEQGTLESIRELIQEIRVSPDKNIVKAKPDNKTFTRHLFEILAVIEQCQKEQENPTWNVWLKTVEDALIKQNIRYCFDDFIQLYAMGKIFLTTHKGQFVVRINYLEERPYPLEAQDANDVIRELLYANNGTLYYNQLQSKIIWVDDQREDILLGRLEHLEAIGDIQIGKTKQDGTPIQNKEQYRIKLLNLSLFSQPVPEPKPALEESDYIVLNAIEDREAAWINFGVVEQWHTKADLLSLDPPQNLIEAAIPKLIAHGHLMVGGRTKPLYRTRMAEMARELRLIKQRFKYTKADDSPYLTRAMKVLLKDRSKPTRDQVLRDVFNDLRSKHTDPDVHLVCDKFKETFLRDDIWTSNAKISGFQKRSWESIFAKWLGVEPGRNVVLTADTGAGKTEATCIPIIMGAMVDHLKAKQTQEKLGCSAILIYPRIRLANNQAHRLTHYLQLLHEAELPLLTIGLQTGAVPFMWKKFGNTLGKDKPNIWKRINETTFVFPFFKCPACDHDLHLYANQGHTTGVDKLLCSQNQCGWSFSGWVGTKIGLHKSPPTLFLPTADSLHQWLQNVPPPDYLNYKPSYPGNIFGDLQFRPPKAILADEIHLYSMTMGSQFAYTLRRALYRLHSNSSNNVPPLAIGMSATLSEPCILWSELTGRDRNSIHHIHPKDNESKKTPIGREYYYFMQPEIESKGKDIAGASSTIQNVMCIAHNMRRRTGKQGGYRSVVFMDSLDKVKRLSMDFKDAEENQKLSQLRIPNGSNRCCNQPDSCARFQKGECWYFAGTDHAQWTSSGRYLPGKHLTVSQPISSQLKNNAEDVIFNSDIVFATSSLEVGFDDPDMMMVYQHYSPTNLASFVQRKGRGGRGADDRPITGVTLSSYSPTDTWYFRYPERMIESTSFEVPINTRNFFVQRGQVLAFMFDLLAQKLGQTQGNPTKSTCFNDNQLSEKVRTVFGPQIFQTLGHQNLNSFWTSLVTSMEQRTKKTLPSKYSNSDNHWRTYFDATCTFLADPISLPDLKISVPGYKKPVQEDIAFAFSELSPGKVSYRWGRSGYAHWNVYQGQFAPLFAEGTQYVKEAFKNNQPPELPKMISSLFPKGELPTSILRPRIIAVEQAGQNQGGKWIPNYKYQDGRVIRQNQNNNGIVDKSTSSLLGTLLLEQDHENALTYPLGDSTKFLRSPVEIYRSNLQNPTSTGLRAIKVFWGADIQLSVVNNKKRDTLYERVTFSDKQRQHPTLYGYMLDTEGVSLPLNPTLIHEFLEKYIDKLSDEWCAHHRLTFFQYTLLQHTHILKLNSYEIKMLTDLIAAGSKDAVLKETLTELIFQKTQWKKSDWTPILKSIYNKRLRASATISERRIDGLLEKIDAECNGSILPILQTELKRVSDKPALKTYLESCLLHSWAIRFKDLVTKHGHGDARRLMLHAKLPLDYDTSDYTISVVELGSFGDGTVRTFEGNLSKAFADWNNTGLITCQNARTDRALEALINMNPRPDAESVSIKSAQSRRKFVRSLNLDLKTDLDIIQLCIRLIAQSIEVQGDKIQYLDLFEEVYRFKNSLVAETQRLPNNQELISLLMNDIRQKGTSTPVLQKIYRHYQSLQADNPLSTMDDSTSPERRLMNQIYQVSGTLCLDGCQGCLHQGSDIVSTYSANLITSRRLLQDFWEYQQKNTSDKKNRSDKSTQETHPQSYEVSKPVTQKTSMDPLKFQKLFDGPYLSLMTNILRLSENSEFNIDFSAGGDISGDLTINDTPLTNVVIGSYLTKLQINDRTLFLIPEDQQNSQAVQTILKEEGDVMLISPRDKVEDILDYMGAGQ